MRLRIMKTGPYKGHVLAYIGGDRCFFVDEYGNGHDDLAAPVPSTDYDRVEFVPASEATVLSDLDKAALAVGKNLLEVAKANDAGKKLDAALNAHEAHVGTLVASATSLLRDLFSKGGLNPLLADEYIKKE